MRTLLRVVALPGLAGCLLACGPDGASAEEGFSKLGHVVVIYLENRSFDNLYGEFPGASGIKDAGERATQVGPDGKPFAKLPQPYDAFNHKPDTRIPADLPNKP